MHSFSFYCYGKQHGHSNLWRRGIKSVSSLQSIMKGREGETQGNSPAVEEQCLLLRFNTFLIAFMQDPGPCAPVSTSHTNPCPPSWIIDQDTVPTGNLMEVSCKLSFPLLRPLWLCGVDKTLSRTLHLWEISDHFFLLFLTLTAFTVIKIYLFPPDEMQLSFWNGILGENLHLENKSFCEFVVLCLTLKANEI